MMGTGSLGESPPRDCGVDGGGGDEGFKGTFTRGGRLYVGGGKAVRACVGGFPHGGGDCVW